MSKQAARYAQGTTVEPEVSRTEIERLLRKHGAAAFGSAWEKDHFIVMFELHKKRLRFDVPAPSAKEYPETRRWKAEERRRWRALLLILKAKLELVASGDADFEAEFMSQFVLPDGSTVGEHVLPALNAALSGSGPLPPLLGGRP